MSAKWRALQHRHRYTYSSVVFPKSFVETLDEVPPEISSKFEFFPQLKELASLNSTYSQIPAVKSLSSSFAQLLSAQEIAAETVAVASKLYLEILFLENSLPLHRTLISPLTKNRKFLPLISSCFQSLCEEYGDLERKGTRWFLASRAALSLMGYPKLGFLNETVEKCSVLVADDVTFGLKGVLADVVGGSRPSPIVMEQCQEAMSCLYYLLQRFPTKFVGLEEGLSTFESIVRTILSVLKSSAFSRDCLVAAGVSFCAALQVHMSLSELAVFISKGFFGFCGEGGDIEDMCVKKLMPGGDLYSEICGFSVLSRLCMLRGILTAIPRTVLNTRFVDKTNGSIWTILYDGILPELCKYCENPTDSHFNFHALTVAQIGLQQIKTSVLGDLTDFSGCYDPLSEEMMGRILRIIWNNLEDPLNQTVKQVHLIFDLLLDIEASVPSGKDHERTKLFLFKITADLLRLGPRCKGRYVPLASLTRRLGAKSILDLNPNLLFETIYAYVDDDVCCSVTSFLKCFLECLRDECWSHHGVEKGYESFRGHCLPPLLHGLVSGRSKLRSNLNTYALPVVLEIDSDSIFEMLAFISVGPSREESEVTSDLKVEQCIAALVSVLKVSRMLALIEGDIDLDQDVLVQHKDCNQVALICVKGTNVRIQVQWFILALIHADESLRIDAAEFLFLNPKTASLPSLLELSLLREAVSLNMRCCSTSFQMKWTSLFRKFFSRVRTALERQVKQGLWQPVACSSKSSSVTGHTDNGMDMVVKRAASLFQFMKWLSSFLLHSCYPSAPYERKTMAMELILIMLDVWPASTGQGEQPLYPYSEGFTSPESTLCLVGSIVDSWDRLRESSFRILLCFPTPLPGINSRESVYELIKWAKNLVCSPRVRESDAGALAFRLIFRKYVLELQWAVGVSNNVVSPDSRSELIGGGDTQMLKFRPPVVEYILSLVEWLQALVEEGERDLSEACSTSFVHGVLLTLRYTFEELNWNTDAILSSRSYMRCLLQRLLELIMRVTSLALGVVSADAWHMAYDMDDLIDDGASLTDVPLEMDIPDSSSEPVDKNSKPQDDLRPTEQAVMVGCWLAMKEVSLLLGTIIRKIPLPSCAIADSSKGCTTDETEMMAEPDEMLDMRQLETIGSYFLQVLLKMKHNGAIDKTRAGFTALCNRLLCSDDPRLCKMTESWMEQLMERTIAKGQTVDDLLRRSAGIPAAFIALFLSEPEGMPKKLLPRALRWLIDVANMSLHNLHEDDNYQKELLQDSTDNQPPRTVKEAHANEKASKVRDEGVIPTVHAFNVLRAAFNDANLAADTSGFSAETLIIAIRSFSSPYWEVRNSACLAYTALIRRMIGFLNIQKRESARRALTGLEFFHRYPALHPFLFSELKIATELLGDESSSHRESNIMKSIHPSLCPILILLSRLKPSLISSVTDDALDPILFMPFIQRCGTQSNFRVRLLASRL
ncbi:thyroid adenoma-associated protein-like protein [Iris pallida]|uniref:Thyroid adenoma-associated protein-like protein n=1 Tax=Iris pallida TaxID=29817 RepID=A0AAX6FKL6_IRIPA|nr:thyroid adenoma-associated protein-like protein [Iris pallida]